MVISRSSPGFDFARPRRTSSQSPFRPAFLWLLARPILRFCTIRTLYASACAVTPMHSATAIGTAGAVRSSRRPRRTWMKKCGSFFRPGTKVTRRNESFPIRISSCHGFLAIPRPQVGAARGLRRVIGPSLRRGSTGDPEAWSITPNRRKATGRLLTFSLGVPVAPTKHGEETDHGA